MKQEHVHIATKQKTTSQKMEHVYTVTLQKAISCIMDSVYIVTKVRVTTWWTRNAFTVEMKAV